MIKGIEHIGIAVRDIISASKFYKEILGLKHSEPEVVEEQKVKVISFKIGNNNIELLQATSEESAVHKFIEKRGEGIHHIALSCENIEKILLDLEEKGVTLIDKKPRIGAHNKKIAFIHPIATGGVLIELCE